MRILNEQEKRELLQEILIELSKSQDVLKDSKSRSDYFLRLESIYFNTDSENFRHYYSDIFACLTLIEGDSSIGNLDILAQNMQTIKNGYVPQNKDDHNELIDISKEIIKLYDHTNLDISRINYTKRISDETLSELAKARSIVDNLQQHLKESEREHTKVTQHLNSESQKLKEEVRDGQKKMQNEYITILGIFASIVLSFTGGMSFSSSVLENIHKASIYRLLTISLILGLVLFNLIWLLIDFIRDINGKSIRKWWFIIVVNIFLNLGLLFSFISYKNHWLENKTENDILIHESQKTKTKETPVIKHKNTEVQDEKDAIDATREKLLPQRDSIQKPEQR